MKVLTYFDMVPGINDDHEAQLLERWARSWGDAGWDPMVLGPQHAEQHPEYHWFRAAFDSQPTINPREYERACWLRWLAYSLYSEECCVVTDYDVKNMGYRPPTVPGRTVALDSKVLSCCLLTVPPFLEVIPYLLVVAANESRTIIKRQPHNSDMYAFQVLNRGPERVFDSLDLVGMYPASKSPLVHVAGVALRNSNLTKVQAWDTMKVE